MLMNEEKQKLDEFNDEEQTWLERALVVMEPKLATGAFLTKFPRFFDQGFSAGNVKERIYTRFKQAKYDKTRPHYHAIQKNSNELHEVLKKYTELYPVTDPIERLNVLEQMRQNPDDINSKLLRVMEIGARIFEKQAKTEREQYNTSHFNLGNFDVGKIKLVDDTDDSSEVKDDDLPESDQNNRPEDDPKSTEDQNTDEEEENHLF